MATNWSKEEAYATVKDYFSMLSAETMGIAYNKTDHRRNLILHLEGRSDSAIERKHQNISAILLKLGMPYIEGYKPLGNYQALLEDVVFDYLNMNAHMIEGVLDAAEEQSLKPSASVLLLQYRLVDAPTMVHDEGKHPMKPRRPLSPLFDFAKREANNRSLGKAGEGFVIDFERDRLSREGQSDLAVGIEWTSEVKGHGTGFDVLSFERNGEQRFIEVKTTNCGREFPFFVSRNEVEFSNEHAGNYYLYRVFNFSKEPKLFILQGSLEARCRLTPETYRANFT
jgi:hypothetical protein